MLNNIEKALLSGNIREVNILLGHCYFLKGKVIHGRQLGRTLGFPTANLMLTENSTPLPAHGVYAVRVEHHQTFYNGMVNIGIRPTFNLPELTIEVNLFDFSSDIYGHHLTLFFIDHVRDEMKFPDLESLKLQLSNDRLFILNLLNNWNQTNTCPK